jgi:hypothetical protein
VALFLVFAAIFFHAPARQHSSDNNLLFFFAGADSPLKSFSVPLTSGVTPKRFHSHNDCRSFATITIALPLKLSGPDEQSAPLFKALSYGAASVEADIYLVGDELLVSP